MMMMLRWVLVAACLVQPILGFRILAFLTIPATGHHNVFAPIIYELGKRGHQVVYVTSIKPRYNHQNVQVRLVRPFMEELIKAMDLANPHKPEPFIEYYKFSAGAVMMADYFFGDPTVQELIHCNDTFDAVLLESHMFQEPASALIHRFGCVGIELASVGDLPWLNEITGLPDNPAYQVNSVSRNTDSMTFLQRLRNCFNTWMMSWLSYYQLINMQIIMDKYFNYTGWEDRPPVHKLISNRSMVLVNRDHILAYPAPTAPHVKSIGGLNIVPNNPLPKDLQKYMDDAKGGVIYFSFGSVLKTSEVVSGDIGKAFMTVFSRLPQRVLLKWESDVKPKGMPDNVKTSKWFPQQDVLAHKNCLVFITHGGLQSTTEAVYNGVPVIGVPFFADQPKNMVHAHSSGYGIYLDHQNITEKSLSWALNEILHNQRYKEEAVRRSNMLKDRRHTGLEEATYWIEYAIKYPNALTPKSAYLTFVQLHLIDVYVTIAVVLYIFWKLSLFILSRICRSRAKNAKKKLA